MAAVGVGVGAVGLSLVTLAYHWLFYRRTLYDGQYAMIFMLTMPVGAVLGAATGYAWVVAGNKSQVAGIACLVALGVATVPFGIYLWMPARSNGLRAFIWWFLFALPCVLWMGWLLLWGIRFLLF